jgi:hypothetical protein
LHGLAVGGLLHLQLVVIEQSLAIQRHIFCNLVEVLLQQPHLLYHLLPLRPHQLQTVVDQLIFEILRLNGPVGSD